MLLLQWSASLTNLLINGFSDPWIKRMYCVSVERGLSNILKGIFFFSFGSVYGSAWKCVRMLFLRQSELFLRKCTVSFIYLWVSSGVFRRVGITGITLKPSVSRLHVALIDFSPSLLKCTINQYSNKSSFILEKCSFQLSGHEVLVLSVWSGEWRWSASGLGPHLPNNWYLTVNHRRVTTEQTTVHAV